METIEEIIKELHLEKMIRTEDIPNVDLYVDQIVQLFESTLQNTTRNEEDKVMTKTMINNYAKGKLLPPVKGKKYTKEQIMIINFIYHFKSILSLQDCKTLLDLLPPLEDSSLLHDIYKNFSDVYDQNQQQFIQNVTKKIESVKKTTKPYHGQQKETMEQFLILSSLLNTSMFYKRLAEKMIDEMKTKSIEQK